MKSQIAKNVTEKQSKPKELTGIVVSTKMKDTIVVEVDQFKKAPKYGKFIKRSKRFLVHDEGNKRILGEKVIIQECRPISKNKHFRVLS